MSGHSCAPPTIAAITAPQQPDWTCGKCRRVWREVVTSSGVRWWAEVRGPK